MTKWNEYVSGYADKNKMKYPCALVNKKTQLTYRLENPRHTKEEVNAFVYDTHLHRDSAKVHGMTPADFNGIRKLREPPEGGWKYKPASFYEKRWRDKTNAGYVKHIEQQREQERRDAGRNTYIRYKHAIRPTGWRKDGWRITQTMPDDYRNYLAMGAHFKNAIPQACLEIRYNIYKKYMDYPKYGNIVFNWEWLWGEVKKIVESATYETHVYNDPTDEETPDDYGIDYMVANGEIIDFRELKKKHSDKEGEKIGAKWLDYVEFKDFYEAQLIPNKNEIFQYWFADWVQSYLLQTFGEEKIADFLIYEGKMTQDEWDDYEYSTYDATITRVVDDEWKLP